MSGYRSGFYRDDCSTGCAMQRQPDLTWMVQGHTRKIMPTDVDQMWEAGGQFLFVEIKAREDGILPGGQRMALKRLSALPGVTVLVMRPSHGDWFVRIWKGGRQLRTEIMTADTIWLFIEAWIAAADALAVQLSHSPQA